MHMDPMMPVLVGTIVVILLVGAVFRRFRQPPVIAYLAVGILLGPYGLRLLTDVAMLSRVGDIGVVLLLFFLGLEVSLPKLVEGWRVAVLGTGMQILASVGFVLALGLWLGWPWGRIILLGFVISLSSTAFVVSFLKQRNQLNSAGGRDALGVLLAQDVALVPMFIIIGLFSGSRPSAVQIILQLVGGAAVFALLALLFRKKEISLPFGRLLKGDHEMQVFGAFLLCFGFALISGVLGLSAALGAFLAGVVVAAAKETQWVHHSLEPFRVVLVALFFVSVGMLIDLRFLVENVKLLVLLLAAVLLTNLFINALILRSMKRSWAHSLYVGALLSQIGEFSFVLAAVGVQSGMVSKYGYQVAIAVIALSLLASSAWVAIVQRLAPRNVRLEMREVDS